MSRILFIPKPFYEESPTSVLMRMAIRHGCVTRKDVRELFGLLYDHDFIVSREHPVIQGIAAQAGLSAVAFLSGFYEPVGPLPSSPPLIIAGITVKASLIHKKGAAFCSECREEGREYFIKDLTLSICCPYHMRRYLTECPSCSKRLHWSSLLSGSCRCKQHLISPPCTAKEAEIEVKLLKLFRSEDKGQFKKFEDCLSRLGYQTKQRSDCCATRTVIAMAFAVMEHDLEAIISNLYLFHAIYPEIPKRIICAKLARFPEIPKHVFSHFLTQCDIACCAYDKEREPLKLRTQFSISADQICAWQGLLKHHWRTVLSTTGQTAQRKPYNWQQALTFSEQAFSLKLSNGFSQKKSVVGISVKDVQRDLLLSVAAIRGAIAENLLTPIRGCRSSSIFDPAEVMSFSEKFISVQLLSIKTGISTHRIRYSLKKQGLQHSDFKGRKVRLHVMSAKTAESVVSWCNSQTGKKTTLQPRASAALPRRLSSKTGAWLTTAEAAKALGTGIHVVRYLVLEDKLPSFWRKEKGGGFLIERAEIDIFKSKYIGITEASTLLDCSLCVTSKHLKNAEIAPITGPGVDKNLTYYFPRIQTVEYALTVQKLKQAGDNGYSIIDAGTQLSLSVATITDLLNLKILDFTDPISQKIRKDLVNEFYSSYVTLPTVGNWLDIPERCVLEFLVRHDILPIINRDNQYKIKIYRIRDIAMCFQIPESLHVAETKKSRQLNVVRLSHIRIRYNISAVQLGMLFLTSGFARPLQVCGPVYITKDDADRICEILNKYCTISQASRFLEHPHFAANLTKTKKISIAHPVSPYSYYPMIEINNLQNYARSIGMKKIYR
ncbi:TniQ family protein [Pseudomonas coronafaciens]|nr:TniQ family protein [Pseudomonas coronafaciens]